MGRLQWLTFYLATDHALVSKLIIVSIAYEATRKKYLFFLHEKSNTLKYHENTQVNL